MGMAGWFSYGFQTDYNAQVNIKGLNGAVDIAWRNDRIPVISARTEQDVLVGLGYAHALRNGLPMAFWRQIAIGKLSQWYEGDSTAIVDEFTTTLGFRKNAQEAYRNLPFEEKKRLEAYATGVNAVFQNIQNQRSDDLLLSGIKPEPWQPWESLAVEQLLAWVGADEYQKSAVDTLDNPAMKSFLKKNYILKKLLRLHGFQHDLAWTANHARQQWFFQRHVFGASAWPLYQEVMLKFEGQTVQTTSIPGTLLFPSGRNEKLSWHVFLTSSFTAEQQPAGADSLIKPTFDIFQNKAQDETLVTTRRSGNALYLREFNKSQYKITKRDTSDRFITMTRDTTLSFTWVLRWNGLRDRSDQSSFTHLLHGDTTNVRFQLWKGNGLMMYQDGHWRMRGNPAHQIGLPGGLLVSDSPWAPYTAERLNQLLGSDTSPERFLGKNQDTYSPWVQPLAKSLIKTLEKRKDLTYAAKDALTYLRNWKYDFSDENIAGSIFDGWMAMHLSGQQTLPPADTTWFTPPDSLSRVQTSQKLKDSLFRLIRFYRDRSQLGSDFSRWQWQFAQSGLVYYPLWSTSYLPPSRDGLAATRFAPVQIAGLGHPSTIQWRATRILTDLPSPAAWESWFSQSAWNQWTIQRSNLVHEGLLARYSIPERKQILTLELQGEDPSFGHTRLLPDANG